MNPRRWRFAAGHACRWVLANVTEFDRRHLLGALRWLFGPRVVQTRMVRPVRRIFPALIAAAWLSVLLVTWTSAPTITVPGTGWVCSRPSPYAQDIMLAAVTAVGVVAAVLLTRIVLGILRRQPAAGPPVPVRVVLRREYSDGTVKERPLAPGVTVTMGRHDEDER